MTRSVLVLCALENWVRVAPKTGVVVPSSECNGGVSFRIIVEVDKQCFSTVPE